MAGLFKPKLTPKKEAAPDAKPAIQLPDSSAVVCFVCGTPGDAGTLCRVDGNKL